MRRIKTREILFKLVFELCFHKPEDSLTYENIINDENENIDKDFLRDEYPAIIEKYDELVSILNENLENYTKDRIYKVDFAILLMAIYELKYTDTDDKIVVNEAIELSKKYSTDKSYSFINGVLAKVIRGNNGK